MLDSKQTFTKFFRELLADNFPNINFYPEPNFQILKYPAIVFHWGSSKKTNTTSMWMTEVQIDILFTEWKRAECDQTTQQILEQLNLAADIPGAPRRTPKNKYLDEDGKILRHSQPYIPLNSDIQWRLLDPVDTIYEEDMPELMRNTFTLSLYYKNR
jgi:hypothetical protein